jgi:hypothetical protein
MQAQPKPMKTRTANACGYNGNDGAAETRACCVRVCRYDERSPQPRTLASFGDPNPYAVLTSMGSAAAAPHARTRAVPSALGCLARVKARRPKTDAAAPPPRRTEPTMEASARPRRCHRYIRPHHAAASLPRREAYPSLPTLVSQVGACDAGTRAVPPHARAEAVPGEPSTAETPRSALKSARMYAPRCVAAECGARSERGWQARRVGPPDAFDSRAGRARGGCGLGCRHRKPLRASRARRSSRRATVGSAQVVCPLTDPSLLQG